MSRYTLVDDISMTDQSTILVRLADALGVPVDAFLAAEDGSVDGGASLEETAELIDAFRRITDRQARRRCLNYVKLASERSELR